MKIEEAKECLKDYGSITMKTDYTKALNIILNYIDELEKKVQSND